jgi:predicted peroxiredoxin
MVDMNNEKRKLVVVVSGNANGDKSTVGFTMAHAAHSAGMDVLVFLVSDGVELCREGASDLAHVTPFRPLSELMEDFAEKGGTIAVCGSCFQYRGMKQEHNLPKVQISGVTTLAAWLAAGATTVSL